MRPNTEPDVGRAAADDVCGGGWRVGIEAGIGSAGVAGAICQPPSLSIVSTCARWAWSRAVCADSPPRRATSAGATAAKSAPSAPSNSRAAANKAVAIAQSSWVNDLRLVRSCAGKLACASADTALAAETANVVPGTEAPRYIAATTATRTSISTSAAKISS